MTWWKRMLFGKALPADETNPNRPSPNLPGWKIVNQDAEMTVWRDDEGDVVSLTSNPDTDLLDLSDSSEVRQGCRAVAESVNSGLVEADIVQGAQGKSVTLIYKRLDKPAFVFTGMLLTSAVNTTWLWTVVAHERGMTGSREAIVTAELMSAGLLSIESYKASWAMDPYDPSYEGVDRSTLRYMSDDEGYDDRFPSHPLSKVRKQLRELRSVSLDMSANQ